METYNLDLEFLDDQKSGFPHSPIANVSVKTFSRRTSDGPVLITPDCVSFREFEFQVNRLKSELDEVLSTARTKFATDNQRHSARAASKD